MTAQHPATALDLPRGVGIGPAERGREAPFDGVIGAARPGTCRAAASPVVSVRRRRRRRGQWIQREGPEVVNRELVELLRHEVTGRRRRAS